MVTNAMKKSRVNLKGLENSVGGTVVNICKLTKEGLTEKQKVQEIREHTIHSYGGREFQEDGKKPKGGSKKQQLGKRS